MQLVWFIFLFATTCLEALGRRYLPGIPSSAFYFMKDVILLWGYLQFRPPASVGRIVRNLYRGFGLVWTIGFVWTVIELFNPSQLSLPLALMGLRAYWLWWMAPPLIASVLQNPTHKKRAIYVLVFMAIGISALAMAQFAAPANSSLNLYTVVDGEEVYSSDVATVAATGRARVASTFAYVTGFQNFVLLVPTILLSLGLEIEEKRLRWLALVATLFSAAAIPMTGSRASVLLGASILVITMWSAGLFFTRIGRRILIGAIFAAVVSVVIFPEALAGVESRFDNPEETDSRYVASAESLLPPMAMIDADYPVGGIGTGMQQNARFQMHAVSQYNEELEPFRILVELGPVGFLAIWFTKVGLVVALFRGYGILKRAGRRGAAAAALSYGAITMTGNLTYDHVFQALYFIGCGFILAEVVAVLRSSVAVPGPPAAVPVPGPTLAPLGRAL
jgi:hypothetical protein